MDTLTSKRGLPEISGCANAIDRGGDAGDSNDDDWSVFDMTDDDDIPEYDEQENGGNGKRRKIY